MNVRIYYLRITMMLPLLLAIGCQTEDLYVKSNNGTTSSIQIKRLSGREAKKASDLLRSKLQSSGATGVLSGVGHGNSRTDLEKIDFNTILMVLDTLGVKNYTFKIINHPDDDYKTFHNLVLTEKEAELDLTVMKYEMKEEFAQEYIADLKSFYEFQGKITAAGLTASIDPCQEIAIDYPTGSTNPSEGGGGGAEPPSAPVPGGGDGGGPGSCVAMTVHFVCSCGRSYNSWDSYTGSMCGDGSNPGYTVTIVVSYTIADVCRTADDPCTPIGVIGVIHEEEDCNTSKEKLKLVFQNTPDDVLEEIATNLNEYGKDFGIDTKEKLQHFLSQAGHESTNVSTGIEFGTFEENLNYRINKLGTADYWDKYFNTVENPTANPNKANPNDYISATNSNYVDVQLFANYVYNDANRSQKSKLGNVNIGDGYKFRGRGIIQLTGRDNYTAFNTFYQENYDNSVNLIENPELVASDKKIAVISALWFFKNRVIDIISGGIDENTTVKKVTELVNGGTNGLQHRIALQEEAKNNIDCL